MFTAILSTIKFLSGCFGGNFLLQQGYNISGSKVIYKNAFPGGSFEVEGVDISSFKVIPVPQPAGTTNSNYFATDRNRVYYYGGAIPGSDGNSFVVLSDVFAKDKNQCYFRGQVIQKADPVSFTVKQDIYAADKAHIFQGTQVLDTDPSVFESFDSSSVIRTRSTVNMFGKTIALEQGVVFTFLAYNYYALNGQVYSAGKPMPGANAKSFKALTRWVSVSAGHVYYDDKIITGADPASFQLLEAPYAKDASHVFFFERIIAGADPTTFTILNNKFQCARDKHALYHEDKKIEQYTAADMTNPNECYQCNEKAIYFKEK